MKCKQCKAEMTEWQRTKIHNEVIVKYRCDLCGWETAEVIGEKAPAEKKNIFTEK